MLFVIEYFQFKVEQILLQKRKRTVRKKKHGNMLSFKQIILKKT